MESEFEDYKVPKEFNGDEKVFLIADKPVKLSFSDADLDLDDAYLYAEITFGDNDNIEQLALLYDTEISKFIWEHEGNEFNLDELEDIIRNNIL